MVTEMEQYQIYLLACNVIRRYFVTVFNFVIPSVQHIDQRCALDNEMDDTKLLLFIFINEIVHWANNQKKKNKNINIIIICFFFFAMSTFWLAYNKLYY